MRYLPHSTQDREQMLAKVGVSSVEDLFVDVPELARLDGPIHGLPLAQGELEVERWMQELSDASISAGSVPFFCGAGAYRHHVPATVDHLIQRSEFLTTYTPYQPEMAQGTVQTLFEFQSQVAGLLACDVANASMYDGSTACAEAVVMAARVTKRTKIVFSGGLHPHYRRAARTLAKHSGLEIAGLPIAVNDEAAVLQSVDDTTACVVVQCPNVFGTLTDFTELAKAVQAKGALLIAVFTEAVAFGLIKPPGEMGADIVVGEGQSIGNSLNFGGPYVGLFATKEKYMRQMPGRLAGETVDADGNRGFVLTLSTREQHIRRDKATSNICTNSGLCALAFTIHMTLLGDKGLKHLAQLNHEAACETADAVSSIKGVELVSPNFFNEFAVRLPSNAAQAVEAMAAQNVLGGVPYSRLRPEPGFDNMLLIAATETTTAKDIATLTDTLKKVI
ncbi:aminomethyl-transferring glycine dehydrogenase subunit GcvPA [Candidatus Phycosocius spiralis]|uniref:Probable glycine dehydrogenase (decarboxylating) subunit 1 n=1 Tax=Candidatus Phycosocius spiralis TaxID=2815099 RepID=A0ABQ4PW93_9PROT|nr:aminomethyl-transferring glycine dehydrogenase subunit GcvPA [Candidatus Phycosocius spiralis]GIU67322.1 putative glycine dehydrogenase (decarboxylating) subunit 1 [Candidatus Phycosocius spiralis]